MEPITRQPNRAMNSSFNPSKRDSKPGHFSASSSNPPRPQSARPNPARESDRVAQALADYHSRNPPKNPPNSAAAPPSNYAPSRHIGDHSKEYHSNQLFGNNITPNNYSPKKEDEEPPQYHDAYKSSRKRTRAPDPPATADEAPRGPAVKKTQKEFPKLNAEQRLKRDTLSDAISKDLAPKMPWLGNSAGGIIHSISNTSVRDKKCIRKGALHLLLRHCPEGEKDSINALLNDHLKPIMVEAGIEWSHD